MMGLQILANIAVSLNFIDLFMVLLISADFAVFVNFVIFAIVVTCEGPSLQPFE